MNRSMTTRVKICGLTSLEDACAAVEAGADALGFNFWPGSKRCVTVERVASILALLPSGLLAVGVFVNASRSEIVKVLQSIPLGAVQLHGDETPEDCTGYPVKVIKALRARAGVSLAEVAARYGTDYILLDTAAEGSYGGTGRTFAWNLAVGVAPGRRFDAGGRAPDNVAEAVQRVRPYAVDVASGVESEPGRKDHARVREFIRNAKAA